MLLPEVATPADGNCRQNHLILSMKHEAAELTKAIADFSSYNNPGYNFHRIRPSRLLGPGDSIMLRSMRFSGDRQLDAFVVTVHGNS